MKQDWLVKTEPGTFSIEDLEKSPGGTTLWDGVRNYQARNSLRAMKRGDRVLVYHSNAEPSGVAGLAEVVREHYPDPTALDPRDPHFDPKATAEDPIWSVVDLRHVATFPRVVELAELKATKGLEKMGVVQKGTRLSVTPVTAEEMEIVLGLATKPDLAAKPGLAASRRRPSSGGAAPKKKGPARGRGRASRGR